MHKLSCLEPSYSSFQFYAVASRPQSCLKLGLHRPILLTVAEREWILTDVRRNFENSLSAFAAELARASFVLFGGLLLALTLLAVTLAPQTARAQETLGFLDYDGTIVENRKTYGGTHSTTHVLFQIQEAGMHLLSGVSAGNPTIEVSHQDYHRIVSDLGKNHGQPGSINLTVSLEDGRKITPGLYFPRYPDTFKYFRESQDPTRNYLLEDFIRAEEKSPNGEFKGKFWEAYVNWCSTSESAKRFTIFTARGHSEKEWNELFDYQIKKGYIKFRPGRVVNLSRSEFDRFGMPDDMPGRKANYINEQVQLLSRINLPVGELHTVIIADDEQRNIEKISAKLEALAFSGRYPVRMYIANAGLRTEVRDSRHSEFAKIEPGSSFRPADRKHFFPVFADTSSVNFAAKCEASFVKVGVAK